MVPYDLWAQERTNVQKITSRLLSSQQKHFYFMRMQTSEEKGALNWEGAAETHRGAEDNLLS